MLKSGFVAFVGRTNSGKSSLINYLIGEKICLVSHKINATRRKMSAIAMHDKNQIILIDTPGINDSEKLINKKMVEVAIKSISDTDLTIFCATVFDDTKNYEQFISKYSKVKHILAITQIDRASKEQIFATIQSYSKFDNFLSLIPVSVKKRAYRKILLDEVVKFIPEHEYFYDPQNLSFMRSSDIYREFILESLFQNLSSEIPYCSDAIVNRVIDDDKILKIYADIITDNEAHKKIIIGKDGQTLKRIGIVAKKMISKLEHRKIFINLQVKIKKSWNLDENLLNKSFIY